MDLMKMGTDMLMSKLGAQGGEGMDVGAMLGGLLGDGESPDLGGLMAKLQEGGAGDMVSSWLGSGENQPLDPGVLQNALDGDKLASMASSLGVDQGNLLGSLSEALPSLIDQASPNGELLDLSALTGGEGAAGIMGMVGKLFGR